MKVRFVVAIAVLVSVSLSVGTTRIAGAGAPGTIQGKVHDEQGEPLAELGRLLRLHRAYEKMNRGDEAIAAGEGDRAARLMTEHVLQAKDALVTA